MAAMFDFRSLKNAVAYPVRFIFGSGLKEFEGRSSRAPLVLRWRRGDDGGLESRWERDE